jgi:hypothetical protein
LGAGGDEGVGRAGFLVQLARSFTLSQTQGERITSDIIFIKERKKKILSLFHVPLKKRIKTKKMACFYLPSIFFVIAEYLILKMNPMWTYAEKDRKVDLNTRSPFVSGLVSSIPFCAVDYFAPDICPDILDNNPKEPTVFSLILLTSICLSVCLSMSDQLSYFYLISSILFSTVFLGYYFNGDLMGT